MTGYLRVAAPAATSAFDDALGVRRPIDSCIPMRVIQLCFDARPGCAPRPADRQFHRGVAE